MILNKLFNKIKKIFHLKILKRKYFRYGKCLKCGCCCENIYIRHHNDVIKTQEEFQKVLENSNYSFYKHITIIGQDDFGLVFECNKFDKEKRICLDHKNRPPICKNYPSEEIFSFGAALKESCGYRFEPIETFSEVYSNVCKHKIKEFDTIE